MSRVAVSGRSNERVVIYANGGSRYSRRILLSRRSVLLFCCRGRARQVQEAEVKLTSRSFEFSKVEADEATQSDWLWGTGGGATIHRAGKIPIRLQF